VRPLCKFLGAIVKGEDIFSSRLGCVTDGTYPAGSDGFPEGMATGQAVLCLTPVTGVSTPTCIC